MTVQSFKTLKTEVASLHTNIVALQKLIEEVNSSRKNEADKLKDELEQERLIRKKEEEDHQARGVAEETEYNKWKTRCVM